MLKLEIKGASKQFSWLASENKKKENTNKQPFINLNVISLSHQYTFDNVLKAVGNCQRRFNLK